jgi:hypothetical protein
MLCSTSYPGLPLPPFITHWGGTPSRSKSRHPWTDAVDAVLGLQGVIQDMALLHAPAAYVPNPGPNAPIDSALDLIYTSVLRNIPPNNFGKSSLILTPIHAYTSIVCLEELHMCDSLSASFWP